MPDDDETDTYVGPDAWVKEIGERADGSKTYIAGPRSKKYDKGEIVPNSYAKSVLGSINFRNRVYGLVDNESEETPDTYAEARKIVSEFKRLDDEFVTSLTDLKGIGPARAVSLRSQNVSFEDLQQMSTDEIAQIKGIGPSMAADIAEQLENAGPRNEELEREMDDLRADLGSP